MKTRTEIVNAAYSKVNALRVQQGERRANGQPYSLHIENRLCLLNIHLERVNGLSPLVRPNSLSRAFC